MTDEIGKNTPQDKEQRRRAVEDAVLAFRPAVERELADPTKRVVPPPDQAVQNLDTPHVRRLRQHRLIIDGLLRARGRDNTDLREPIAEVLRSTLPSDIPASRVEEAIRHLNEVTTIEGEHLRPEHWERWTRTTRDIFRFTAHERTLRACDDRVLVKKFTPTGAAVDSRRIVAEFWSDLPPSAFAGYIDPMKWPDLSGFWVSMTPVGQGEPRETKGPPRSYNGVFQETVEVFEEILTVPLEIAYRERADQSRVWARFNIARGHDMTSVPVDVDTGTVSAELVAGGPARTLVQATKYLHWADNREDRTELACDLEWADLMVEMAYKSLEPADIPASQLAVSGTTDPTSIDGAVQRFVSDVSKEWKNGIDDYAPELERLIGRFTGPTWNLRWVNDLLAMGKVAADTSGKVASHIRCLADSLQAAAVRKDEDERR